MSVRIIHTADVHLDSPFTAFTPSGAEKRRENIRKSFLALIEKAREEKTQLFLISGDLFDTEFATRDTALMLKNAFLSALSPKFFNFSNTSFDGIRILPQSSDSKTHL